MKKLNSPLALALLLSLAVHAVLLTVRFVAPEQFNRVFKDTALEVILVNAQSQERPENAQAIAQANLAGGGDVAQGRATSPMPYSALTRIGDDFEERQRQIDALQERQTTLLTQLRQRLAALPEFDPREAAQQQAREQQEQKRKQLLKQLAELEKRINEENARPKKRYISPATKEAAYAVYYDALRHKVEEKGTENFPEVGGRKLYGDLIMVLTINHDGRVLETEIVQSSGQQDLDRRAQAIAYASGPFGSFTPAMRAQADQIVVVARFSFTRDQVLQANVQANER
ncbi:energy transducer TonB [Comamonas denitrificans]|uniref:Energy transducer TonB n=1 Tax=Comamonas denitrificans TaxID=117506 RepID=A0A939GXH6_9BURK|nr:energy transducer TonB [Comamonas denitrificans]MBP6258904.1 energy transducer TonB [Comamonas sp.]